MSENLISSSRRSFCRHFTLCGLAFTLFLSLSQVSMGQSSPAPTNISPTTPIQTPSASPDTNKTPETAPSATPTPTMPAITPPATPAPQNSGSETDQIIPPPDTSASQMLELTAHPAAVIRGEATWDKGYDLLQDNFIKIKAEMDKEGLTTSGNPLAIFTQTDDSGFHYEAMIPLTNAPQGKEQLSDQIKIGQTPTGKAIKFQHRGPYSEIDSTYEAITAFLDEKGLEAENLFIEEYLNEPKTATDPDLQIDIYVLIKAEAAP